MASSLPHILYVSYDGMLEPLGESQVVSYLERLASAYTISVLSFEKHDDLRDAPRVSAMERRLGARDIAWRRLRYHKRPQVVSTALDVIAGIVHARAVCRRNPVAIVHARGYVPALIALGSRGVSQARFLFDMRGFWVDEKVEAGHWPADGMLYRVGKWWERRFFGSADAIVSLTEQGASTLAQLGYDTRSVTVEVVPTCVDLQRFTPGPKDPELLASLGLGAGGPVIGCVGTMSNWYMRDEMLWYLARLTQAFGEARILIVTREDTDRLRRDAEHAGIPGERLVITRAAFADMPRFIRLFDAGLFFIRPTLSKRGSAATKLAEFLACGVPVIINDGVGDSGAIVRRGRVGVVLPAVGAGADLSLGEVRALLDDRLVAARCRQAAAEVFDLERGADQYRRLYAALVSARDRNTSFPV